MVPLTLGSSLSRLLYVAPHSLLARITAPALHCDIGEFLLFYTTSLCLIPSDFNPHSHITSRTIRTFRYYTLMHCVFPLTLSHISLPLPTSCIPFPTS